MNSFWFLIIQLKDLYGDWYNKVGHHSALFHSDDETGLDRELNTVNYKQFQKLITKNKTNNLI